MTFPPGTRFTPKDRVLVSRYLYKMVEKKQSSFITTMDVYKDEPWLLDHVTDPLFKKRQWYYFVPRTIYHGNVARRTVPGRGESEGGLWKSTDKKKEILNRHNRVIGYKQCFSYNKIVQGKDVNTDWNMTEYSLPKGKVFQDLVLCSIRQKKVKEIKNNPQPPQLQAQVAQAQAQVVENTINILSNQPVQEEAELTVEELDEMLFEGQEEAHEQDQENILSNQPVQEEAELTVEELDEMLFEEQEEAHAQEQNQAQAQVVESTDNILSNQAMQVKLREIEEMLLQDDPDFDMFDGNDNLCFTFE